MSPTLAASLRLRGLLSVLYTVRQLRAALSLNVDEFTVQAAFLRVACLRQKCV